MTTKYYLIRTPNELVKNNLVGYGWKRVDFSMYSDVLNLLKEIETKYKTYGRKKNQIKRFFNLKKDDIVVVPMKNSILIGVVIGGKSYSDSPKKGYNRVSVDFMDSSFEGGVRRISTRTNILTNSFLSRLRLRSSNASLDGFSSEINNLMKTGGSTNSISLFLEKKLSGAESRFKNKLLENIKSGKNLRIKGGGDGFESLICELLKIEGYTPIIQSKKSNKGSGDIDIVASKDEFYGGVTELVIQAKHHKGITKIKALNQVVTAIKNREVATNAIPIVISSAIFNKTMKEEASLQGVKLMDGEEFIEWLYRNLSKLSVETQLQLGITQVPLLIEEIASNPI